MAVLRNSFILLLVLHLSFSLRSEPLAQPARDHWAFQALSKVSPPSGKGHPIDQFIARKLRAAGLDFSHPAERRVLVRRLFFDLHGLPPTSTQAAAFVKSTDADAYPKLIDSLLASPRYGERWAQHWLDLVRYADTHGFEVNTERANAWPYRDYVIRALNEDRSYQQFILEQLAGDSIGEDAATGFLVAAAVLLPGQIGKDEASKRLARQDSLDEIVVATGDSFLGLSIGCARCHDHKFDPISQRDYYALQAVFAGVEYGERPLRDPDKAKRAAKLQKRLTALRDEVDETEPRSSTRRILLIDDEDTARTTHLISKNGHGANPAGTQRGYRDDPGTATRSPNLGRARYTWWTNRKGEDVFTYDPKTAGRFRLWLSWGVHGSGVHTRDARYLLDRDGDLATTEDQQEIARADQSYFVGQKIGETEKKPLWSGFHDAGIHELTKSSRILLRAGDTGTGITADVIILEEPSDQPRSHLTLRAPVNSRRNVEEIAPVTTKHVRFTSLATIDSNKHEPCLDELELFTPEGVNFAPLAEASSSGNYVGGPQHQLDHINDGKYGNSRSWISSETGKGWVQLSFAEPVTISRIVWGRDRTGQFPDRLAVDYRIEVAGADKMWSTVASSTDRQPYGTPFEPIAALLRNSSKATPELKAAAEEIAKLQDQLAQLQSTQNVYAGKFRSPDPITVLHRGDPEQPGAPVTANIPSVLGSLELSSTSSEQERRLALAHWIASPSNPLTARVQVNRVWQLHFGKGLVETASDFGLQGTQPSHPDLLDWLAGEFIRSGWSLKKLHRLILTSRTYQQSNRLLSRAEKIDQDCRLLWRFPTRRLEAEAIRDSILAVSGTLNPKMGGPGFNFFSSRGGLSGFPPIDSFKGEGLRRMIYAHKVRMERVPIFGAFDCPDAGQATPRRSRATTAIQALNLFNSAFMLEQATAFAHRITKSAPNATAEEQIALAFRLAFARPPGDRELSKCIAVVKQHGLPTLCRVLFNTNEFLFLP